LSKLYARKNSFVIDNASSKSIPKYRKEKSDAWSKDKLTVHIGGTFEDETDSVLYYLYPEIISESSNTILTQIHFTLLRLSQRSSHFDEITFIFDNHSTQKNYFIVCYLHHLILNNFFKKGDGFFLIVFMMAGHTHNRLDNANSKPRIGYFKEEKIETLHELNSVYRATGSKYNSQLLQPVFDFATCLNTMIDKNVTKKMMIKKCHQLKVTKEGVYTKQYNEETFSTWRGRSESEGTNLEPFSPLMNHDHFEPNYIQTKMFTEERLKRLSSSFSEGTVEKILNDYLEWTIPFTSITVNPDLSKTKSQNSDVRKSKKTKNSGPSKKKTKSRKICSTSSQEACKQWVVSDVTGRRFNVDKNEHEYKTSWVGFPKKTWEPKSCFLGEDGEVTDLLLEYEEKHPVRKVSVKLESQSSSQHEEKLTTTKSTLNSKSKHTKI
jgi:hypothetical protein